MNVIPNCHDRIDVLFPHAVDRYLHGLMKTTLLIALRSLDVDNFTFNYYCCVLVFFERGDVGLDARTLSINCLQA